MGYGWSFRDGDWERLRQIIQKISRNYLGPEASPTFGDATITNDLTVGGDFDLTGGLTIGGTLILTGFTPGSVLFIGASSDIEEDNTNFFFDDTAETLKIANDLTLGSGSITSASGAISFGDENLTTTSRLTVDNILLTCPTVDVNICSNEIGNLAFINQSAGQLQYNLLPLGSGGYPDGSEGIFFNFWAKGDALVDPNEQFQIGYAASPRRYQIRALKNGSGTLMPIHLFCEPLTTQLVLGTTGNVSMSAGDLTVDGGDVYQSGGSIGFQAGTASNTKYGSIGLTSTGGGGYTFTQSGSGTFTYASNIQMNSGVRVRFFSSGNEIFSSSADPWLTISSGVRVRIIGGNQRSITEKTGAGSIATTDYTVLGDTTAGGDFALSLPSVDSDNNGQIFNIKNIGTGTLTINRADSDTIDGATSIALAEDESITIQYYHTDTDWAII
jgi:hypothetical protein